jgi:hypothetical protein
MSVICKKCGADISFESEHHLNCEVVAELMAHLQACASKLRQLGQTFSSTNFTDRHGDGPYCLKLAENAMAVVERIRPSCGR